MALADIGFWIRSARTDAYLARLQHAHGTEEGLDKLYASRPDPWGYLVPHYRYQRLKYAKLLAALPARPYLSALDIGCGLGVFTRMLSPFVDQVVGMELSGVAVRQAEALSSDYSNVHFAQATLLDLDADQRQPVDLVVLADILYYLSPLSETHLASIVRSVEAVLKPDGILLLANHFFFDLDPQSRLVRQIHRAFQKSHALHLLREERHPFFLVSTFQKLGD
jgi:predicted TPR repeat methyltransferase